MATDGACILVDRLWSQGIMKSELVMDDWIKELSLSSYLRQWFNHDSSKFKEFEETYR